MTTHPTRLAGLPTAKKPLVPSGFLGSLIFVGAEVMFFSGITSALTISRAGAPPGTWPAPGQPPLASGVHEVTVAVMFASGALLFGARRLVAKKASNAPHVLLGSALLGALFVGSQVMHGSKLLASGLTMTSSQHASFFFLLGGLLTIHAAATVAALLVAWRQLSRGALSRPLFDAVQVFWYFVVVMWPVIYARVYV